MSSRKWCPGDIPLADLLRLEIQKLQGNGSEYFFPEQAEIYGRDPDKLIKRFRRILSRAGFHDEKSPSKELFPYDPKELAKKAEAYFKSIPTDQKREKARAVFSHYVEGKALCESADQAWVSKATASAYLNEIEAKIFIAFIRGNSRTGKAFLSPSRGAVHVERKIGLKRACWCRR